MQHVRFSWMCVTLRTKTFKTHAELEPKEKDHDLGWPPGKSTAELAMAKGQSAPSTRFSQSELRDRALIGRGTPKEAASAAEDIIRGRRMILQTGEVNSQPKNRGLRIWTELCTF